LQLLNQISQIMSGRISAHSNEDYDSVDYWNKRYEIEDEFEWCKDYEELKSLFSQTINKNDSILILGIYFPYETSDDLFVYR